MGAYVMLVTQAPTPLPPAPTLDPNFLASQLIPLIAMVAGLVALGWVARWFFRSPRVSGCDGGGAGGLRRTERPRSLGWRRLKSRCGRSRLRFPSWASA
jgi:hypothetical protein